MNVKEAVRKYTGKNSLLECITKNMRNDVKYTAECLNKKFKGTNFKGLPEYEALQNAINKYNKAVKNQIVISAYKSYYKSVKSI